MKDVFISIYKSLFVRQSFRDDEYLIYQVDWGKITLRRRPLQVA